MTEVIPGIHRLKLPITLPHVTLPHVNAYLVQGDGDYLLVDTGWNTDEAFGSLKKQLAEISIDLRDISRIVVTHIHPDHYGLAGRLKTLSGAELTIHDIEQGFIESRYIDMESLLRQTSHWLGINGVPPNELAYIRDATVGLEHFVTPTNPDITIHGGETIAAGTFTFRLLWTPGHSPGHVCLYEPEEKVLIAGDHILPTITPNVGSHPQSIENPLGQYLNSLNELRQLDTKLVLPGHEDPFTELKPRIDELIQHHEQRNLEILAIIKDEARTAYQIAREVIWGTGAAWQNMPFFHKRLAISETLAHLTFMADDGRLKQLTKDGIIYYRQT